MAEPPQAARLLNGLKTQLPGAPSGQFYGGNYLVDGRQAMFSTREKAAEFREAMKLMNTRLVRVTLCQSPLCIPAIIDPTPEPGAKGATAGS